MTGKAPCTEVTEKREISLESYLFVLFFLLFFSLFVSRMGLINTINTMMNTAYALLIDTVLYLTAICVLMGAMAALFTEFGVVSLVNRLLKPLMQPIYGLPGAAALGIVTTFLSDNPAILTLANDRYFKQFFKRHQFPALTNLGTSFGMGLIVCTYMLGISARSGFSFGRSVTAGLAGAVVGSIVSTRTMMVFTKKHFGADNASLSGQEAPSETTRTRPVRPGGIGIRLINALLEGGADGVNMGASIIPGVLIICTFVMMLTNQAGANGMYSGAAYEGIGLLPSLAEKAAFLLDPLFGFSSPEAISVPITALGAAGAATSIAGQLVTDGLADAGDVAVFTAMCMCWSGYLSTHVSMMSSLGHRELIGKAIISHTIGGISAGVAAHWIFELLCI